MDIYAVLAKRREDLGISKLELANYLNIPTSDLKQAEDGNPKAHTLEKVIKWAEYLGLKIMIDENGETVANDLKAENTELRRRLLNANRSIFEKYPDPKVVTKYFNEAENLLLDNIGLMDVKTIDMIAILTQLSIQKGNLYAIEHPEEEENSE